MSDAILNATELSPATAGIVVLLAITILAALVVAKRMQLGTRWIVATCIALVVLGIVIGGNASFDVCFRRAGRCSVTGPARSHLVYVGLDALIVTGVLSIPEGRASRRYVVTAAALVSILIMLMTTTTVIVD